MFVEVKSLGTVFYVVLFFLCLSRYWSQETQKGHSPKLYKAIIRILWWKLLLNFLLAALKVSAINMLFRVCLHMWNLDTMWLSVCKLC